MIFVTSVRHAFQSDCHRFVGIDNTSILGLVFTNIAAGFSTAICWCFTWHCCWHRNFHFSGKEWEKLEKIPAWHLTKVRNQKEVIEEARTKGRKVHFASLMDLCHLKNSELDRASTSQVQRQSRAPRWHFEGWFRIIRSIYSTRIIIIIITNDSRKSHGHYFNTTGMRRTSSRCSIRPHPDAPKSLKLPKSECPDIWMRLPKHKWPESKSCMDPSFFSTGIRSSDRTIMGKAMREQGCEIFQTGNVYLSTEQKDFSYLCMWTISEWQARQKTQNRPGKSSWKTSNWENQHHSSTMFIRVALKENVRSARILWIITEGCSNQGFLPGLQKNRQKQKTQGNLMPKLSLHGPMTWKVTQRNAWKGIANLRLK